jgi:hypothetical protein
MQNKLLTKLSRNVAYLYSLRLMLFLLLVVAVFFWLFNFSSMPFSNPSLMKISGGVGLLDVMPYYSGHEAFAMLNQYGAQGRDLYLRFLVADFMFIPAYSLGFALLFTRTLRAKFREHDTWLWLNLLPLACGLFDCLENLCVLGMLFMYPGTSLALGTLSGLATLGKTVLTFVSLLCMGSLAMSLLIRRMSSLRQKNSPTSSPNAGSDR